MNEQLNDNAEIMEGNTAQASNEGQNANSTEKVCSNCKSVLVGEDKFCPNCGTAVWVDSPPKVFKCNTCGVEMLSGSKFCPNCGGEMEKITQTQTVICQGCGTELTPETKFCSKCGKEVPKLIVASNKKSIDKKKLFLIGGIALAVIAIITTIILCIAFREIPVESMSVSKSNIEMKQNETITVSCKVYPAKATDKTVTWSSSDNSVATVSSHGMIKAVGKGTCTIIAKAGDKRIDIAVTVKSNVDFEDIYGKYCSSSWASYGDSYLSVDTNPKDYVDGDYTYFRVVDSAIKKIHRELGLPDSLYEDMSHTTWSMGKQIETYEEIGVTVTWTYHPDKGLEITYKLNN